MSSLSTLMDLSRSALLADQAALSVTSSNVANQNTVGYTDEVVAWTQGDTISLSNGVAETISGPTVATTSLRNRVLETRVQQQTQAQAGIAAEAGLLSQVESVFSISGSSASAGSTQLGTSINSFFSSLSALAANPSDEPTQQAVLSAAQNLAIAFNAASRGLDSVQASINSGVATSVTAVNSLTQTIATLNAQITSNDPNHDAGALEDRRQTAIAQLSQLIGVDQVKTENNGITLTTTSGATLVSGDQAYALSSAVSGGGNSVYDSTGADISTGITGGGLGGQLAAQNTDLPPIKSALDALAFRIATAVNLQNQAGQTSAGMPGGAIFAVPASGLAPGAAGVLSVIPTSPGAIATAGSGEGATGNTNITALAALQDVTDSSGQTVSGNLATLVSDIGSTSSTLQQQSATQQASLQQLTTQRDSLSGVNLDTEASNLTTYQRAYQAAAQVMVVINTLLAAAINMGSEAPVA